MGLYRNLEGKIVEVTDEYGKGLGYQPVTAGEQAGLLKQEAATARQADVAESAPLTALRGLASGATLGLSDVLTGATTTENNREEILAGVKEHPIAHSIGELAGAVVPAFAAPGSLLAKTPAGYLSRIAGEGVQAGRAIGGLEGAARVVAAAGSEGAIQSAGAYLGHVAMHDDADLTVEGMSGALGRGFAFGGVAGGAMLGIEKGMIGARKLFAKEGAEKAATLAESTWKTKGQEILDATEATATKARQILEEASAQRAAAEAGKKAAAAGLTDAQAIAKREAQDAFGAGLDTIAAPSHMPSIPLAEEIGQKVAPTVAHTAPVVEAAAAAAPTTTRLERQLAEMQQKIEGGASLGELSAMPRQNIAEIGEALQAVQKSRSEVDALLGKVDPLAAKAEGAIEHAATTAPARTLVEDVAHAAEVIGQHEKDMARLTEAVGEAAHPTAKEAAKGFRAAEAESERKYMDRAARAVDDASEKAALSSKDRIGAAREAKAAAEAWLAETKAAEAEAKSGDRLARAALKDAKSSIKETAKAAETIGLPKGKAAPGRAGTAANIGAVLEAADTLGVPGLPKPKDIPVIGPLLSMYLKYRALKAVAGKMTGAVEATGNAKAAAMAAQTKDKVMGAVDKMLGLAERAAPAAIVPAAALAGVLAERFIDDGTKNKGTTVRELAADRIREVNYAAQTPSAIIAHVREQLKSLSDPDLLHAAEQLEIKKAQYLADKAPKQPMANPLAARQWTPSQADATSWGRRLQAIDDPVSVLEGVASKMLSREAADAIKTVYPKLFEQAQQRLIERASEITANVPFDQRQRISALFDVPLDRTLEPTTISLLQTVHKTSAAPSQAKPAAPTPSLAGPVNLAALYQTRSERRAQ